MLGLNFFRSNYCWWFIIMPLSCYGIVSWQRCRGFKSNFKWRNISFHRLAKLNNLGTNKVPIQLMQTFWLTIHVDLYGCCYFLQPVFCVTHILAIIRRTLNVRQQQYHASPSIRSYVKDLAHNTSLKRPVHLWFRNALGVAGHVEVLSLIDVDLV